MTRRRRWLLLLALAGLVLAGAALVLHARLPGLLLDRFHRDTARLGADYRALAAGVDVDLLHRRYRLRDVRIVRRDGAIATPLVTMARIDVQLEPLARRSAVHVDGVRWHLVGGSGAPTQLGEGIAWRALLESLAPGMPVQRLQFEDVALRFHLARHPALVVTLDNLHGEIDGLATTNANVEAQGLLMAHAPLRLEAGFDPQGAPDSFRLRARAHEVELARFDAFLRRWGKLGVQAGAGSLGLALDWTPPRVHGAVSASFTGVETSRHSSDARGMLDAMRDWIGAGTGPQRIDREFAIDARVDALPDDNFEGLRALLDAAFAGLGRYLPG